MKLAGAYINDDTYQRLVALAEASNRTLAGQCRHLFDRALRGDLPVPDCAPPAPPATANGAGPTATRARRSSSAGRRETSRTAGSTSQSEPPGTAAAARTPGTDSDAPVNARKPSEAATHAEAGPPAPR